VPERGRGRKQESALHRDRGNDRKTEPGASHVCNHRLARSTLARIQTEVAQKYFVRVLEAACSSGVVELFRPDPVAVTHEDHNFSHLGIEMREEHKRILAEAMTNPGILTPSPLKPD
jgi:hypothetical protein